MLSNLPGGKSVTARVANCLPLGNDGKYFLIGAALYTHGNFWGIADPPADWGVAAENDPVPANAAKPHPNATSAPKASTQKKAWPYNLFPEGTESTIRQK